jgi:predicted ATPase
MEVAARTGHHYFDAELHRLKGTLTEDASEAEACFVGAIDIARAQQAKSFELRAATSLSRLWTKRGKAKDARALLSPIYGWFTEGFETSDLHEARSIAIPARLSGRRPPKKS